MAIGNLVCDYNIYNLFLAKLYAKTIFSFARHTPTKTPNKYNTLLTSEIQHVC